MLGDGVIDVPRMRGLVDAAGFRGFIETEILSAQDWRRRDPEDVIRAVKDGFVNMA